MLDITPLKNAANQLEQSLIYAEGELAIAKAELIYKVLPEFLQHVRSLIKHLEAKQ